MNTLFAVCALGLSGAMAMVLVNTLGRVKWGLSPILLFIAFEVLAVWPSIIMAVHAGTLPLSAAVLVGCALLAATYAFILAGGLRPEVQRWRGGAGVPSAGNLRALGLGLGIWMALLVGISLYQFHGPPPFLSGGLQALLAPEKNGAAIAQLREGRRALTKGYLVGDAYRGQGIVNALTEAGWQWSVVVATCRHLWLRNSRSKWQLIFVAALAFIFLASTGKRAPLVIVALCVAASISMLREIRWSHVLRIGLSGAALLIFISPLSKGADTGGTDIASRQSAVIDRVTQGNGRNNVALMSLVNQGVLPEQGGRIFYERLRVMVPGAPTDPLALRVTRLAYGGGKNTTGFSTPTQLGWLYADGAAPAVILGYAMTGMMMAWFWVALLRRPDFRRAIIAGPACVALAYQSVTGLQGFLAWAAVSCVAVAILFGPTLTDWGMKRGQKGPMEELRWT